MVPEKETEGCNLRKCTGASAISNEDRVMSERFNSRRCHQSDESERKAQCRRQSSGAECTHSGVSSSLLKSLEIPDGSLAQRLNLRRGSALRTCIFPMHAAESEAENITAAQVSA